MSSIAVTIFRGKLVDEGCVPGPVPRFLLPDSKLGPGVDNGSLEISSNISGFNECLKRILLVLRQM